MAIIGLEGMPGVGKTTSIKRMGMDKYFKDILLYPETDIHVENEYIMTAYEKAGNYFKEELDKNYSIINKMQDSTIILDRTYISLIAYQYALVNCMPNSDTVRAYDFLRNNIIDKLNSKLLIQPNIIVIILIEPFISLTRRIAYIEDNRNELWFNPNFLNPLYDFYNNNLYKEFYSGEEYLIDSQKEDLNSTYKKIKDVITQMI